MSEKTPQQEKDALLAATRPSVVIEGVLPRGALSLHDLLAAQLLAAQRRAELMRSRGEALEEYLMGDVPPPDDDETSRPSPLRSRITPE